jgi:isopentenyl diphosphate isomerase/L-lactate dehydrogenase-like FMN-dependent dehydrogenase
LHPEDATIAASLGAKAIFISNHGGRQLDGVPTALEVLPMVAKVLKGKTELFVDGGIRRGTDIIKAILLGANGVLIGKPMVWALAVGGEAGVLKMMKILEDELRLGMCLLGCSSLKNLDDRYLFNL